MSRNERNGELAASAITELFYSRASSTFEHKELMHARRKQFQRDDAPAGTTSHLEDPYIPWLAANLLWMASEGELFVRDAETVSLRVTWEIGDDNFWYIGQVQSVGDEAAEPVMHGPWILWRSLGNLVTPNGPDDRPSITDYKLSTVDHGDIVEFDLYRLPRDTVKIVERLDPASALKDDSAELVLRLRLPVVTE